MILVKLPDRNNRDFLCFERERERDFQGFSHMDTLCYINIIALDNNNVCRNTSRNTFFERVFTALKTAWRWFKLKVRQEVCASKSIIVWVSVCCVLFTKPYLHNISSLRDEFFFACTYCGVYFVKNVLVSHSTIFILTTGNINCMFLSFFKNLRLLSFEWVWREIF